MTSSDRELDRALRALAEAELVEAPRELETRLLTVFRTRARHKKKIQRWTLSTIWAATAAMAALLVVSRAPRRAVSPPTKQGPVQARPMPSHNGTGGTQLADSNAGFKEGFVPVADADLLGPMDYAAVVRVELPRPAAMRMLGASFMGDRSEDVIQADLLVGQDGMARALRLVQ